MTIPGGLLDGPICLDYNATTPIDTLVTESILLYLIAEFGNPSSTHHYGRESRIALDHAWDQVADAGGHEGRLSPKIRSACPCRKSAAHPRAGGSRPRAAQWYRRGGTGASRRRSPTRCCRVRPRTEGCGAALAWCVGILVVAVPLAVWRYSRAV